MNFGFSAISGPTKRLIILSAGALLLVAAGQPQNDGVVAGPTNSDAVLAHLSGAEAAQSTATLAAATTADIAAENADVTAPAERPANLTTLIARMDNASDMVARDSDMRCLATAVYFESRGEPLEGQLAVAQSILNRVESGRYAGTVCGVVNQPGQFSFDRARTPRAGSDWNTAQAIAQVAMQDLWVEVAPKAMSFHATYVAPNWAGKTRIATIGHHVFYR